MPGVRLVLARRRPRREPEVRPQRLVHTRAGAEDVEAAELGGRDVEHAVQGGPGRDVRLDEDGARGAGFMAGECGFGFRAEGEVGHDDVAAAGEEELRECKIDT